MRKESGRTFHLSAYVPLGLLLLLLAPISVAAQSGCTQAAERWILQLEDPKNRELFERYTTKDCQLSGKWVRQSADLQTPAHRERLCTDLVLIWSHKNCNFFRDLINPEAFEPCKAWSRQMYRHCMENDLPWFP